MNEKRSISFFEEHITGSNSLLWQLCTWGFELIVTGICFSIQFSGQTENRYNIGPMYWVGLALSFAAVTVIWVLVLKRARRKVFYAQNNDNVKLQKVLSVGAVIGMFFIFEMVKMVKVNTLQSERLLLWDFRPSEWTIFMLQIYQIFLICTENSTIESSSFDIARSNMIGWILTWITTFAVTFYQFYDLIFTNNSLSGTFIADGADIYTVDRFRFYTGLAVSLVCVTVIWFAIFRNTLRDAMNIECHTSSLKSWCYTAAVGFAGMAVIFYLTKCYVSPYRCAVRPEPVNWVILAVIAYQLVLFIVGGRLAAKQLEQTTE